MCHVSSTGTDGDGGATFDFSTVVSELLSSGSLPNLNLNLPVSVSNGTAGTGGGLPLQAAALYLS